MFTKVNQYVTKFNDIKIKFKELFKLNLKLSLQIQDAKNKVNELVCPENMHQVKSTLYAVLNFTLYYTFNIWFTLSFLRNI